MGKGFGAVYSPKEKETATNGLSLDLSIFNEAGYLLHPTQGDKRLNVLKPKMVPALRITLFIGLYKGNREKYDYLCNQNTTALMT